MIDAGAAEQARLIAAGEVSARELIEATLQQIDRLDPQLNAYRVVLADEAMAAAARIDSGDAGAGAGGLLAGVPVAIKDDTDVAGQVTAFGTAAHGDVVAAADAEVVARLRAAGAIVIGKTHVPELTLWPWTASTTWGVTRHPTHPDRTPGGSSGGSAVAVATGMCGIALGTDGGGSIRYPAVCTGVFGLKPQRGRVPMRPGWNGLTVAGPLARSAPDAALFLDAVADDRPPGGYVAALARPLPRLRIAVSYGTPPGTVGRLSPTRRAAVVATAERLEALGHEVVEREVDYGLRATSSATVRYLAGVAHDAAALPDPAALEPTTRRMAAIGRRIPARTLRSACRQEVAVAARINRVFDAGVEVVLGPMTAGPPPLLTDVVGRGTVRSFLNAGVSAWAVPWNTIGQPAASVPVGFDADGLPLAVQLAGRPGDELTLLGLAAELATRGD